VGPSVERNFEGVEMKNFSFYKRDDGLWWYKFSPTSYPILRSDQGFKRKRHCRRSAEALERGKGSLRKTDNGFYQIEWKNKMGQLLAVGIPQPSLVASEEELAKVRAALRPSTEPRFRYLLTAIIMGVIVAVFVYALTSYLN